MTHSQMLQMHKSTLHSQHSSSVSQIQRQQTRSRFPLPPSELVLDRKHAIPLTKRLTELRHSTKLEGKKSKEYFQKRPKELQRQDWGERNLENLSYSRKKDLLEKIAAEKSGEKMSQKQQLRAEFQCLKTEITGLKAERNDEYASLKINQAMVKPFSEQLDDYKRDHSISAIPVTMTSER